MKDTIITSEQKIREAKYFIFSFFIAYTLNVLSIIIYHTSWKELYTSLIYVFILTTFIYAVILFFRWISGKIMRKIRKNKSLKEQS